MRALRYMYFAVDSTSPGVSDLHAELREIDFVVALSACYGIMPVVLLGGMRT
jgi:hypothetical protein